MPYWGIGSRNSEVKYSQLKDIRSKPRTTQVFASSERRQILLYSLPLVGFLLGIFCTVLSLNFIGSPSISAWSDTYPPQFAPGMPMETIVFAASKQIDGRTPEMILPIHHRFVNVSYPEKYGLQPGMPTPSGVDYYSVALLHQLHCLSMIHKKYEDFLDESSDRKLGQEHTQNHKTNNHIEHCFDYLSQSLLCAGDLTIEWARIESDGSRFQVDGWGIPHQCKDPTAIWRWIEENHGPDEEQFKHVHP